MALQSILQHPDPILRRTCAVVTRFDTALASLVGDMFETMYAAPGRGLAAPQVGICQRVFVMDVGWRSGTPTPGVFVNPELVETSPVTQVGPEGCLSLQGRPCDVRRPVAVRLRWQDLTGTAHEAAFDGFAARCVQHERDHLDGILCIDLAEAAP